MNAIGWTVMRAQVSALAASLYSTYLVSNTKHRIDDSSIKKTREIALDFAMCE